MRVWLSIVTTVAAIGWPASAAPQSSTVDDLVWHWFVACPASRTMTLEVVFRKKRIFTSSFPICHVRRAEKDASPKHENLHFSFKAPARIFDPELRSLGTTDIEGDMWEAGSDQNRILLGIDFVAKNQILLNTIHVAPADAVAKTELAEGLSIQSKV